MKFLPAESRPNERAILILYHLLGITNANSIATALGFKSKARIYKTLKSYNGKIDVKLVQEERENISDHCPNRPLITIIRKVR